ncbi:hypothetical protein AJ79_09189 [Helicocarpus griseus UAMH5409]|uniref:Uncharacterized protein n=1 Tax=Helicocarpus griseus UAMH5409 TaxID=1447875 RepID=A0A2B7WLS1_9EURO|nr:hypothetical protein AJ79_09189 [Helicocarpus griseus UAMH5409]
MLSTETKRNLILVALVLVPIILLFIIFAVALACSEYWSLYRQRRRSLRVGDSGINRRYRSDAHFLSSSSESSSASTKKSESSDGADQDIYMKAIGLRELV